MSTITSNLEGLKRLQSQLKRPVALQVGIFSGKSGRKDVKTLDNAALGAIHEGGSPAHGLPARSWLKMPLVHEREVIMKEAMLGALKLIAEDNIRQVWVNVGIACERAIDRAFDTAGFGEWKPLKYETLLRKLKGNLQIRKQKIAAIMFEGASYAAILVRTGQFRKSVGSRVKMGI